MSTSLILAIVVSTVVSGIALICAGVILSKRLFQFCVQSVPTTFHRLWTQLDYADASRCYSQQKQEHLLISGLNALLWLCAGWLIELWEGWLNVADTIWSERIWTLLLWALILREALLLMAVSNLFFVPKSVKQDYPADQMWDNAVKYHIVNMSYLLPTDFSHRSMKRRCTVSISLFDFSIKLHHWL